MCTVSGTHTAVEEGIVAGGGVALLQAGAGLFEGLGAASIAALFLTTAVVIVDKPERNSAGDPSGGMGGVDY